MQVLVFSDTHLTHRFNQKKFNFLEDLIKSVDKVIINGDFWEGYIINFEKFLNSPWQQLFPLLKSKDTVYCYGNHDKESRCDHQVEVFSNYQTNELEINLFGQKFLIKHGYGFGSKILDKPTRCLDSKIIQKAVLPLILENRFFEEKSSSLLGSSFYKFFFKKIRQHKSLYNYALSLANQDYNCVFSHSHYPFLADNYANTGTILNNWASFLIIEDGELSLYKQKY